MVVATSAIETHAKEQPRDLHGWFLGIADQEIDGTVERRYAARRDQCHDLTVVRHCVARRIRSVVVLHLAPIVTDELLSCAPGAR